MGYFPPQVLAHIELFKDVFSLLKNISGKMFNYLNTVMYRVSIYKLSGFLILPQVYSILIPDRNNPCIDIVIHSFSNRSSSGKVSATSVIDCENYHLFRFAYLGFNWGDQGQLNDEINNFYFRNISKNRAWD